MSSNLRLSLIVILLAACGESVPVTQDTTSVPDAALDATALDTSGAGETTEPTDAGPSGPSDTVPDTAEPDVWQPKPDPTDAMFDPNRLLDIEVTIPPEDWDALRFQTRTFYDIFGPGCMEGPFESPFTYFKADVRIDGELVESVGIRKKGFLGSLTPDRPSLKVKFGEYVEDQEFEGMKRLTLNNSRQDPSKLRQCLTYDLFRKAGIVSPRCNWAKITVNGNYLGIYVHVDSIKKPFIRRFFPDDEGTLWEGTLSDFRDGWMATYQQKTNKSDDDNGGLVAIMDALEASDDELFDALNAHMNLEEFIDFWAMEVITAHWDGYAGNTNNFYLYEDPTDNDRITFIPWGADGTLSLPDENDPEAKYFPHSVNLTGALVKRLYQVEEIRFFYLQRLQYLLNNVWNTQELKSEIAAHRALIEPHLEPWLTDWYNWFSWTLDQYIEAKPGMIQKELDAGGLSIDPPLRNVFCLEPVASLTGDYDTTWGTLHLNKAFETGTGVFQVDTEKEEIDFPQVGASADVGKGDEAGTATVGLFGLTNGNEMTFLILQTPVERFKPGAVLQLGTEEASGTVLYMELGVDPEPQYVGFIAKGVWTIGDAGMSNGMSVTGSVTGEVMKWAGD